MNKTDAVLPSGSLSTNDREGGRKGGREGGIMSEIENSQENSG